MLRVPGQGDVDLLVSAKEVYLRAARAGGWSIAWLGAGKAALLSDAPDQAEAGLNEANTRCGFLCTPWPCQLRIVTVVCTRWLWGVGRDNHNPEVWVWLSLLCLQASPPRFVEGMQSLEQALQLVRDDVVLSVGLMCGVASRGLALCRAMSCDVV